MSQALPGEGRVSPHEVVNVSALLGEGRMSGTLLVRCSMSRLLTSGGGGVRWSMSQALLAS